MFAADERYGAVAAHAVAALGYFQIGVVRRGGEHATGLQFAAVAGAQTLDDLLPVLHAEEVVDLGQLGAQLVGIALREAAYDEQLPDKPLLLGRRCGQNRVDTLLLGISYESARVYHDDIRARAVAVEDYFVSGIGQLCGQMLRVDRIFRAAERYDVYFLHVIQIIRPMLRTACLCRTTPRRSPNRSLRPRIRSLCRTWCRLRVL